MSPCFLVTGATGSQGGATARHLLEQEATVHCLVRNPTSPAAQALSKLGAIIFKGDFDDLPVIAAACAGVSGVFLNVSPSFTDANAELRHAQNIVDAAEAAGVQSIVYSSMLLIDALESFPNWPNYPHAEFYLSKRHIEDLIRTSSIKHHTILRPAFLMHNYLPSMSRIFFPELSKDHIMYTSCYPHTSILLLDPDDVGKFAAAAFIAPEKFHTQEIDLGSESLTVADIVDRIVEVAGVDVQIRYYPEEESKELLDVRPLVGHERLANEMAELRNSTAGTYGIKMNNLKGYFEKNREELLLSLECV